MKDWFVIKNINDLAIDMININKNKNEEQEITEIIPAILYTLYVYHLNFNVKDPMWCNRDRVVMSSSCDSAFFYVNLFFAGFNYEIGELKKYGHLNKISSSLTYNPNLGIDISNNIFFTEIVSAVGMALGEKIYESKILNNSNIINFYTYVICQATDLLNGINFEACHFASSNKIGKLIIICYSLKENDVIRIFKSLNWHCTVIRNKSVNELNKALNKAKIILDKPSIIEIKIKKHPKNKLKQNYKRSFNISKEAVLFYRKKLNIRTVKNYYDWQNNLKLTLKKDYPDLIKNIIKNKSKLELDSNIILNDVFNKKLSDINKEILDILKSKFKLLHNLSATKQIIGPLLNGLSLVNLKVYTTCNLKYCDYLFPAIKASAIMNISPIYIFYYDYKNIARLFQTIDKLNYLRNTFNLKIYRPADIKELIGSLMYIFSLNKPAVLIVSNYKNTKIYNSSSKKIKYGAYIIRNEVNKLDALIVATGAEVYLALEIANKLYSENIDLRVVSIPCKENFEEQDDSYKNAILPKASKIFVIEDSIDFSWLKYTYKTENIISCNIYKSYTNQKYLAAKEIMEIIRKNL